MDGKNMTKEKYLTELNDVYKSIDSIVKDNINIEDKWNDNVSKQYIKKIERINEKKKELLNELKKLEIMIKNQ